MEMSVRFRAELSSWQEQVRARFAALVLLGPQMLGSRARAVLTPVAHLPIPGCCCIPRGHRGIKVGNCADEE